MIGIRSLLFWQKPPRRPTAAQITRAIGRRIREAESTGLTRGFVELAQQVFYYPSWIKHSPYAVPAIIAKAREIERNRVELTLTDGSTCAFERTDSLPPEYSHADTTTTVQLFVNGIVTFAIEVETTNDVYAEHWSGSNVTAFIEGPWQKAILEMARQQAECSRRLLKETEIDRLERERKHFGL
ncbi:MAG: hypothetical protein KIT09_34980 [Bryobacteraceae bacterium]|nr:hypothetical protein [Bryobacteraceae bacterium]